MLVLFAALALAAPKEEQELPPAEPGEAPPELEREDRSDFLAGDVDLRLGLGFDGFEPAPWTLVTSFVGWNQLQLGVDVALITSDEATVSVGLEAFYSRPILRSALGNAFFGSAGFNDELDWRAIDRGGLARAALHVTSFSSVDPYGAVLLGPTFYTFEATVLEGPNAGLTERLDVAGLRTGLAGGLTAVAENDFFGGIELRYLATVRFKPGRRLFVGEGLTQELFDLKNRHTGPSGFGWLLSVGHRL